MIDNSWNCSRVFNTDETALFYKQIPRVMLVLPGEENIKGTKQSTEKVSILLCITRVGSSNYFYLFCGYISLRKFARPRCFKKVDMYCLPTIYYNSKKGWMTKFLFNNWIDKQYILTVRNYLLEQNLPLSSGLLFNNCSSHIIRNTY